MCYQVSLSQKTQAIFEALPELLSQEDDSAINFDFAPTYLSSGFSLPSYPVVVMDKNRFKLRSFEWGMIMPYMKGQAVGPDKKKLDLQRFKLLNARAERVIDDHSSVWYKKRQSRLLVPVNGFFEYRAVPGIKNKIPYYIHLKARPLFFLPGLYNYSHLPNGDGELIGTFTIVIRAANKVMREIHNSGDHPYRMPLMLTPELEKRWLDQKLTDDEIKEILQYEMPAEALSYYPVKSLYRADPLDSSLIEPVTYPGVPSIEY